MLLNSQKIDKSLDRCLNKYSQVYYENSSIKITKYHEPSTVGVGAGPQISK